MYYEKYRVRRLLDTTLFLRIILHGSFSNTGLQEWVIRGILEYIPGISVLTRVTRLGEFSPIGWLFWGQCFFKLQKEPNNWG
jgi:hypothetical protein